MSLERNILNVHEIVDNPGVTPIFDEDNPNRPNPNINGYACVTGFFNENYLEVLGAIIKHMKMKGIRFLHMKELISEALRELK